MTRIGPIKYHDYPACTFYLLIVVGRQLPIEPSVIFGNIKLQLVTLKVFTSSTPNQEQGLQTPFWISFWKTCNFVNY